METNGIIFLLQKLSTLLKRISTKHKWDFYFLNCLHLFRTKKRTLFINYDKKDKIFSRQ